MGWFDKHKQAPADDKKGNEQSEAEINALVDRIGASVEEKFFKPLNEKLSTLTNEWEAVKTEAAKTTTTTTQPTNADGTPRQLTEEEKNRNATHASLAVAIQTNARLTENECIANIPAEWASVIPEAKKWFSSFDFSTKAKQDYAAVCNNVVDILIAREVKQSNVRRDRNGTFFLEDKSTSATREDGVLSDSSLTWHQPKADGSTKTWSASEQLRALGIDPEKFAKNVKEGVV